MLPTKFQVNWTFFLVQEKMQKKKKKKKNMFKMSATAAIFDFRPKRF